MNPFSLYDLGAEYNDIMRRIEEADGVLDDELEEALQLATERLATTAGTVYKAERLIKSGMDMLQAEMDRLTKRMKALEREKERWHKAAIGNLIGAGINAIEDADGHKLRLCESESVAVHVAPEQLPQRFTATKTTITADKRAIKEALKAGDEEANRVAYIVKTPYLRIS